MHIQLVLLVLAISVLIGYIIVELKSQSSANNYKLLMESKPEVKWMLNIELPRSKRNIRIVDTVTADCKELGLMLDLPDYMVKNIWISHEEPHKKCMNIIMKWIDGNGELSVTWRVFINALKKVPFPRLAKELETEFEP